jgi:hypothetical protein
MHISVVSIEGDHLADVAEILQKCEYVIEATFTVQTAEEAWKELDWNPDRNRVAKVAYHGNGWTHIIDPELVLMSDDVWLEYSRKWSTRVVGWVCEGASGSYGITVFEGGQKHRQVFACEGEVATDVGQRLPEEADVDWSAAWEDDVLEIVRQIGADSECPAEDGYLVYHLDESQMSIPDGPFQ